MVRWIGGQGAMKAQQRRATSPTGHRPQQPRSRYRKGLLSATGWALSFGCGLQHTVAAMDPITGDLRTTVEFQATSQETRIGASPDRAAYEANIQALIQKRFPGLADDSPGLALIVHTAGRYFDTRQGKHRTSTIDSIDNNALAALGRRYQHYQAILKACSKQACRGQACWNGSNIWSTT